MQSSFIRRKRRILLKLETEMRNMCAHSSEQRGHSYQNNAERFGFEPGPDFTLEYFKSCADEFKGQYFRIKENDKDLKCIQFQHSSAWEPSMADIEWEYWRMVVKPTEEIEVLYGADIETGSFGSGFPKVSPTSTSFSSEDNYVKSGWNLNNSPPLPGSVLAFENTDISGVLVPWLYVGMCFSSFCWHVEDHHFYSLNYMHWGAPKIWYGVPGRDALKLETTMKRNLPDLFEEQPDLLHNLVTQFSPSILKSDGVPVFRCVQNPGEFVLTFPRAYHSGFNCGFNCAEAVNVAPMDWLPHGQLAVELYREQKRKISVSHDKLLLGAAREAVRAQWEISLLGMNTMDNLRWKDACGSDGILSKVLKERIDTEQIRWEYLCSSSQSRKMDVNFDATNDRECDICHYDLHLSAVGCSCSLDRYACLEHGKQMCSCAWDMRFFLFRYDISELNMLLDAVGGKLRAVYKWGKYLGLSLNSYIKRDKMQESNSTCKAVEVTKPKEPEPLNQETFTGVAKISGLSQSIKAPISHVISHGESAVQPKGITDLIPPTSMIFDQSTSVVDIPNHNEGNRKEAVGMHERKELCATEGLSPGMKVDQAFQIRGEYTKSCGLSSEKTDCKSYHDSSHRDLHQNMREQKVVQPAMVHANKHVSTSNNVVKVSSPGSGDKGEEACHVLHKTVEGPIEKCTESFHRHMASEDMVTPCNCKKDQVLETPETDAYVMNDQGVTSDTLADNVFKMSSRCTDAVDLGEDEKCGDLNSLLLKPALSKTFLKDTLGNSDTSVLISSHIQQFLASQQVQDVNNSNIGNNLEPSLSQWNVDADGGKDGKKGLDSSHRLSARGQSVIISPSLVPNTVDRYSRQGPRMAKVVRRVNSVVEPLTYGTVVSGPLWSCGQAIFPKGFRSRVKYFSVLDPTQMCYYISEILDAGLQRPLFMAQMEQCPNEIFIHFSPTKCWEMVRERVNVQIRKQHSLGRIEVPVLQPPGSLDGLEMFGLSSPAITKVIEMMDATHLCLEYWRSKPQNNGSSTPDSLPEDAGASLVEEEYGEPEKRSLPHGTDATFHGLVKKLNHEELHLLQNLLGNERVFFKEEALRLVSKEIGSRPPNS